MTWSVIWDDEKMQMHVVPDEDERKHHLSPRCWCRPTMTIDFRSFVHHAADKREQRETQ